MRRPVPVHRLVAALSCTLLVDAQFACNQSHPRQQTPVLPAQPAQPVDTQPQQHLPSPVDPVDPAAAPQNLQISPDALAAALDLAIVRDHDEEAPNYLVDSFVSLLVIEQLAQGGADTPVFSRVQEGHGYTVEGVAPGSLFARLGIENGDIIQEIDGAPLDSPGRAMLAISDRTSRLELTIVRGGVQQQLTYTIRTSLAMKARYRRPRGRTDLSDSLDQLNALLGTYNDIPNLSSPLTDNATALGLPQNPRAIPGAEEAITCVGDDPKTCTIDRTFVDKVLANPAQLTRQARIVPAIRDGDARGFKLYGIRPGSLPKLLGMKNGDMVTHVNDEALTSITRALDIYNKLRTATKLRLLFERKDIQMTLDIVFQ